jgi:hypothetical protein
MIQIKEVKHGQLDRKDHRQGQKIKVQMLTGHMEVKTDQIGCVQ